VVVKFWPFLLGGISLGAGGLILLVSGPFSTELPFTPIVFCLSLVSAGIAAGGLARRKHWLPAALVLAVAANFLLLSFGPWYVEHWVPGPAGFTAHRHPLWNVGHVH
jgi:hypothetical protein